MIAAPHANSQSTAETLVIDAAEQETRVRRYSSAIVCRPGLISGITR